MKKLKQALGQHPLSMVLSLLGVVFLLVGVFAVVLTPIYAGYICVIAASIFLMVDL